LNASLSLFTLPLGSRRTISTTLLQSTLPDKGADIVQQLIDLGATDLKAPANVFVLNVIKIDRIFIV
jgi:hypothetical protein